MLRALLALVLVTTSASAFADSTQEKNRKVVLAFYELAFNKHQPKEAVAKYIGNKYIQHNPHVPNGTDAFTGYFEALFKKNPQAQVIFKHSLADKDLVALHLNFKLNNEDRGQAIIDLFRLENGKIIEHWDVIQDVPETTANGNTMFEGSNEK